jgi:uncharacterized protein Usg
MARDPDLLTPGYGLTTANILYCIPDHPKLLQSFVWQFYDVAPDHPRLEKFLDHWRREIEAVIHSIEIAHKLVSDPTKIRIARFEGRLH